MFFYLFKNSWKMIPLGIIFFFTLTILKSFSLSQSHIIAFSFAMLLFLLLPLVLKKMHLSAKINQWHPKAEKILFGSVFFIHFIFLLMFSLLFTSEPINDLGTIYHSAIEIVEDGKINTNIDENTSCFKFYGYSNNDYFNNCQNNIMLLLILTALFKGASLFGATLSLEFTLLLAQFLNILCIELSIWIGVKIAKKKKDTFTAFLYLILSFLFLPYYINAFRFYTDTIVLPFAMLLIYLYSSLDNEDCSSPKNVFGWLFMGFIAFFAIQIKQSATIIVIAMFLFSLFQRNKKQLLHFCVIFLPTLLSCITLFQVAIHQASWIDFSREETIKFPTIHWIALGMMGTGSYNQAIVDAQLFQETTKQQKEQIVLFILKKQMSQYENLGDFLNFELEKAVTTWCDGKYYQYSHLEWFYSPNIFQEFLLVNRKIYQSFFCNIRYIPLFLHYLFLVLILATIKRKRLSIYHLF